MINSLYIHIPFCRKKCLYCDFYSIAYQKGLASCYIDILCEQIRALDNQFETIYIGGGTPTVLDTQLWEKLLSSLEPGSKKVREFSLEANPESLDQNKLKLFRKKSVNRISIGVQSLDDSKLKKLGRIHSAKQAIESVYLAKNKGFNNINIDLIFGVWGQSLDAWKKEARQALKLPIKHISLYSLTTEAGTPVFRKIKQRVIKPLDEKIIVQMYKFNRDYFPKQGFFQYEVSNFANKGYQCWHNLNYWENKQYLGLGPSAVSYTAGIRQKRISNIGEYINRKNNGIISRERLSSVQRAKETAALKIRTKEGIGFSWFKKRTGMDFERLEGGEIKDLLAKGLISYTRKHGRIQGVCLTDKGFLFSDSVSSLLL
jgi:oxygen-independent coproporphyrinogen-3 oxidase